MQLQKEVKPNSKQSSCKKKCVALLCEKKMSNPRWQPRNGYDGRLMAKILTMTIQVNLVSNHGEGNSNSPELLLLKLLPLLYHYSHFSAATLDLTSFLQWRVTNFFSVGLFYYIYIYHTITHSCNLPNSSFDLIAGFGS